MLHLSFKALHLLFAISWFAGLFYLPRIFVNLAEVRDDEGAQGATYRRLCLMGRRLYRFMTVLMVAAVAFSLATLLTELELLQSRWMQLKILVGLALIGYHHICLAHLRRFENAQSRHGATFYRWFNEAPAVLLALILILVVWKPF